MHSNTFTAPADATLEANTDYFIVFENTGTVQGDNSLDQYSDYVLPFVFNGNEDSGGAAGWSLADMYCTGTTISWTRCTSGGKPLRLKIVGTAQTAADTTSPSLDSATVDGTSLVLTYDEALDEDSEPAMSAYSVSVTGGTGVAPSSVDVSSMTVTLTLGAAVTSGQTVTVTYTVPTSNPVQDTAGNDAAALTNQSVTNNTNRAPTFASPTTARSFAESIGDATVETATNVGEAVTATDDDNDTLAYTLEGQGAGFFTIDRGSGQIKTQVGRNYNYEQTSTYALTVKANDNKGGTATIAVSITVTDEEEKPTGPGDAIGIVDPGQYDKPRRNLDGAEQHGPAGTHPLRPPVQEDH